MHTYLMKNQHLATYFIENFVFSQNVKLHLKERTT